MAEDFLGSSDSVRSGRALANAKYVSFEDLLDLELGQSLPGVTVCYETYGRLNPQGSNAILICHALSGDSHVARHTEQDEPGWWDTLVGPGKPVDTEKYYVICSNNLGGCRGTTGPNSIDPDSSKPYGQSFPTITIGDMVEVQRRLLDHLGIEKLLIVTGGSMGGQMALHWANKLPNYICGCVPIATASRLTSQSLAFDIVGRNAIRQDPHFQNGQYYGRERGPDSGLAIARMIGHITYLSRQSMQMKFETDRYNPRDVATDFEKHFSVGSYLGYQGDRFVERFDANSYVTLSMAMDLFDLSSSRSKLAETIGREDIRWLILSYTSDWLFPPEESRLLVDALISAGRSVTYCNVESSYGHDSFLLEHNLGVYGELVRAFLSRLSSEVKESLRERAEREKTDSKTPVLFENAGHPASIFHSKRLDYDRIIELIPSGSRVLDLGCGYGELLYRLKSSGFDHLVGVELDEQAIVSCVRLGLDVIHADLNQHPSSFPDGSYDYVVLSQTLQAILNVEGILKEIIRIGNRAIVSFPNFAYHKLRDMLYKQGKAPEASGILRFKWYDTPNRRFFSIADFEELCREKDIKIHKRIALDTEQNIEVSDDPNRLADLAIFVISR